MNTRFALIAVFACFLILNLSAQRKPFVDTNVCKVVKMADGFRFVEGPAADANGNVYFSDIPDGKILLFDTKKQLSVFRDSLEGNNGLAFDANSNLIMCEQRGRRLSAINMETGEYTMLVETYNGKRLNSLNDLWIDAKGGIYFTDPRYGQRDNMELETEQVYYFSPAQNTLLRITDDLVRPNGVNGTSDGRTLYVSDWGDYKVYKYTIQADGKVTNKEVFALEKQVDGMTLDAKGNLYMTSDSIQVYSPIGKYLGYIAVPERPSNVCFGGTNHSTLFITARKSLYAIDLAKYFRED